MIADVVKSYQSDGFSSRLNSAVEEPLGIYVADIASTGEEIPEIYTKWELQNLAAQLLPDERVKQCLRYRSPVNHQKDAPLYYYVEVNRSPAKDSAYYKNLMVCDRPWGCPVCASRISEARRKALTVAIDRSGYQSVLLTLTLSHHDGDDLSELLNGLLSSYRSLKSGRFWQDLKSDYAWVGDVKSLEPTHGENGWHPHIHVLMLFEHELSNGDLKRLETDLKKRWLAVLDRHGMSAGWEHGCDLKAGDQELRDYVAKFGKLPKVEKKPRWTIEHELTKSHVKRGRRKGRTPFQLLADFGNGDNRAGELFVEYYNCFKGRHQLQWSRGLRALLNMDEIEEEIKEQESAKDDQMIAQLDPMQWRKVCYARARGQLLDIAAGGDVAQIWEFIYDLPDPPPD